MGALRWRVAGWNLFCTNKYVLLGMKDFMTGLEHKTFGFCSLISTWTLVAGWPECSVVDCSPWQVVTEHVWSPSQACAISLTASPGLPWNKTLHCLRDRVRPRADEYANTIYQQIQAAVPPKVPLEKATWRSSVRRCCAVHSVDADCQGLVARLENLCVIYLAPCNGELDLEEKRG